jgi:alpha-tubulin suppressor-like RCC1 family protein
MNRRTVLISSIASSLSLCGCGWIIGDATTRIETDIGSSGSAGATNVAGTTGGVQPTSGAGNSGRAGLYADSLNGGSSGHAGTSGDAGPHPSGSSTGSVSYTSAGATAMSSMPGSGGIAATSVDVTGQAGTIGAIGSAGSAGAEEQGDMGGGGFAGVAGASNVAGAAGSMGGARKPSMRVTGLTAWSSHVCVVREDTTLACWGDNNFFVLGNADPKWTPMPTTVLDLDGTPLTGVVQVSTGHRLTSARLSDGRILHWGVYVFINANGSPVPRSVKGLEKSSQRVSVRGWDEEYRFDVPFSDNMCVIDTGGVVSCWGGNQYDGLGHPVGTMGDDYSWGQPWNLTPVPVQDLPAASDVAMATGGGCAATMDGYVYCWGWGYSFANGDPTGSSTAKPNQIFTVSGSPLSNVTAVVGAFGNYCAVKGSTGRLFCWGRNTEYEFGLGAGNAYSTVQAVEYAQGKLSNITGASIGYWHVCAVSDAHVWCSGIGRDYEMGNGSDGGDPWLGRFQTPVQVSGPAGVGVLSDVVEIVATYRGNCVRNSSGEVYCWGLNNLGQTGHAPGTQGDVACLDGYCTPFPTRVDGI